MHGGRVYTVVPVLLSLPLDTAGEPDGLCGWTASPTSTLSQRGVTEAWTRPRRGERKQKEYPLFQSDFIEKETYKNHVQKKLTKHVQKIHSGIYSSAYTVFYRLGHPSPLPDSSLFCDFPPSLTPHLPPSASPWGLRLGRFPPKYPTPQMNASGHTCSL